MITPRTLYQGALPSIGYSRGAIEHRFELAAILSNSLSKTTDYHLGEH